MQSQPIATAPELTSLVRSAAAGDVGAFEQLVHEYGPRIFRFLVVRLGTRWEAEDALQETLVAAWQGLPRLKQPLAFWEWLVGIAVHKAADQEKVRRRLQVIPPHAGGQAPDAYAAVELRRVLEGLPSTQRDVLLLRYILGLSEVETARALGVRLGTVKSRSARARLAVWEAIRAQGLME